MKGNVEIVKILLLQKKIKIHAEDQNGINPIQMMGNDKLKQLMNVE